MAPSRDTRRPRTFPRSQVAVVSLVNIAAPDSKAADSASGAAARMRSPSVTREVRATAGHGCPSSPDGQLRGKSTPVPQASKYDMEPTPPAASDPSRAGKRNDGSDSSIIGSASRGNVVDQPRQPISFAPPHRSLRVFPGPQLTPLPDEVNLTIIQAKHRGDLGAATRADAGSAVCQSPSQSRIKGKRGKVTSPCCDPPLRVDGTQTSQFFFGGGHPILWQWCWQCHPFTTRRSPHR